MKPFLLMLFFVIPKSFALSTMDLCMEFNSVAKNMQQQLPIDVDYTSSLVGINSLYANNICMVNYNFLINTAAYAKAISTYNGLPSKDVIAWMRTNESHKTLTEAISKSVTGTADEMLKPLKKQKNIIVKYIYKFDDPYIKPIVLVGLNTT